MKGERTNKRIIFIVITLVVLIPILVSANADLNNDGVIDVIDLSIVAQDFGKTGGLSNPGSDTNIDGIVDIYDVVYVASKIGTIPPPQTCSDGTPYNQCSSTKPKYCSSGTLINKCSTCGCPTGQTCSNNQCITSGTYQGPESFGWGGGGWFTCMEIDKSNPNIIYAANDMGGMFRSEDGGNNWIDLTINFPGTLVRDMVLSPDGNTLYAQTMAGFLKSTDKGNTWTTLTAYYEDQVTPTKPYVTFFKWVGGIHRRTRTIAIDQSNPNIIYISGEKGKSDEYSTLPMNYLYKTTDGGQTWQEIAPISDGTRAILLDSTNPNIFYAAGPDGVKKSTDGGLTWVAKNNGITSLDIEDLNIDKNNGDLYLLTSNAFYKSTDKAETWVSSMGSGGQVIEPANYDQGTILIDETDSNHIFVGLTSRIYETKDGGSHWTRIYYGGVTTLSHDPDYPYMWNCGLFKCGGPTTDMAYSKSANLLYGAGSAGVAVGNLNSATPSWTIKHKGLSVAVTFALAFMSRDEIYAGGPDTVQMRTTNGGQTWMQITGSNSYGFSGNFWVMSIGLKKTVPQKIYLCKVFDATSSSPKAAFFQSLDYGNSWENITGRLPDYSGSTKCAQVLVDPNNENIVYVLLDKKGLYRSTDNANTFARITDSIPSANQMTFTASSLVIDPLNPNTLYLAPVNVGTSGPKFYRSTDGGSTWTQIYTYGDNCKGGIAVVPDKYHSIYLSFHHRVIRSQDNGATWQTVINMDNWVPYVWGWHYYFSVAVFNPLNNKTYIQVTPWGHDTILYPAGIYESPDFGSTWERKYPLAHQAGNQIYILDGDYLYSPAGSGLWKYRLDISS